MLKMGAAFFNKVGLTVVIIHAVPRYGAQDFIANLDGCSRQSVLCFGHVFVGFLGFAVRYPSLHLCNILYLRVLRHFLTLARNRHERLMPRDYRAVRKIFAGNLPWVRLDLCRCHEQHAALAPLNAPTSSIQAELGERFAREPVKGP